MYKLNCAIDHYFECEGKKEGQQQTEKFIPHTFQPVHTFGAVVGWCFVFIFLESTLRMSLIVNGDFINGFNSIHICDILFQTHKHSSIDGYSILKGFINPGRFTNLLQHKLIIF